MKMNKLMLFALLALNGLAAALGQSSMLDQLIYFASQSKLATEEYAEIKTPLCMENVIANSMKTAIQTCQNTFKWERWNCPASDFLLRRSSKSLLLDREDSYVNAISTAAVLYSITKNCSSGLIAGCSTCHDNSYNTLCSDNPEAAEQLLNQHSKVFFSDDFYGKVTKHNYKCITNLLEKSLVQKCVCGAVDTNGLCAKEICLQVLKPFEDIAADIYQMYEEGLQLGNIIENSRIIWKNIPLDTLVYVKDSPNYCEPDAVPHWNGMRGRQCSSSTNGKNLSQEERKRCRHLCLECGYTVMTKKVAIERRCNCKFTWSFQIQCEVCETVQRQYHCY